MPTFNSPNDALKYHVTGAVERGEKQAIVGIPQAQHTPGPWRVIQGANRIVESVQYGKIALMDTQRFEYEANANLIAAAPEMLYWLIIVEKRLTIEETEAKAKGKESFVCGAILQDIRETIALAKGVSPKAKGQ